MSGASQLPLSLVQPQLLPMLPLPPPSAGRESASQPFTYKAFYAWISETDTKALVIATLGALVVLCTLRYARYACGSHARGSGWSSVAYRRPSSGRNKIMQRQVGLANETRALHAGRLSEPSSSTTSLHGHQLDVLPGDDLEDQCPEDGNNTSERDDAISDTDAVVDVLQSCSCSIAGGIAQELEQPNGELHIRGRWDMGAQLASLWAMGTNGRPQKARISVAL